MTDIVKTQSTLLTDFADNTSGNITAGFARSLILAGTAYQSSSAPTANDDENNTAGHGYFDFGYFWVDTTSNVAYICTNPTATAAVWTELGNTITLNPGSNTGPAITFAAGTSGSSFNVTGGSNTITYNLPNASTSNSGSVNTGSQTFQGAKTIQGASSSDTPLTLKGVASQSGNLTQAKDSSGNTLWSVGSSGGIVSSPNSASVVPLKITAPASPSASQLVIQDNSSVTKITVDNNFKLNLNASTSSSAGLNVGSGSTPSSPSNGDCWVDGTGFAVQVAGSTVRPAVAGTGSGQCPQIGTLSAIPQWQKFTVSHSSFTSTTNGAMQTITVATMAAGTSLLMTGFQVSTGFSGGGITQYTMNAGYSGAAGGTSSNAAYMTSQGVNVASNNWVYGTIISTQAALCPNYGSSWNLTLTAQPDASHALNSATQGSITLWVLVAAMP